MRQISILLAQATWRVISERKKVKLRSRLFLDAPSHQPFLLHDGQIGSHQDLMMMMMITALDDTHSFERVQIEEVIPNINRSKEVCKKVKLLTMAEREKESISKSWTVLSTFFKLKRRLGD